MHLKATVVAIALAMLPGLALAQSGPGSNTGARIDQRQANQQQRINEGIRSGDLTRREAARLQQGQANIQRMEDRARADGKITKQEARQIERAQDRQSRVIARERNDKQHVR